MSIEAMSKALNYIENTEGELGIKLSCGDALREALAAQPPAAPVETATKSAPVLGASRNIAERPPSSDAAESGADTAKEDDEPLSMSMFLCKEDLEKARAERDLKRSSAGSEPVAWMCEKAIWETVETQRIGGRWLRYLTFDRPAEAEYTRNITPLYSVSPQAVSVRDEMIEHQARFLLDRLQEFDPGDFQAERDFHGHIAPAISRLKSALAMTRPKL